MTTPTIKKYYDHTKATKDLREYDADLTVELMRQPGLYAWYSSLLVQAEQQYDRLEHSVDVLAAKLDQGAREEASRSGAKITEGQIKSRVQTDSRMVELTRLLREAKAEVGYLKATCIALAQRKDMLMQMAFMARKEQESSSGNLAVMKNSMKEIQEGRLSRLGSLFPDDDLT